ncbi:MAG: hypothetical protein ABXS93_09595 [Sulfurimonas sp.]
MKRLKIIKSYLVLWLFIYFMIYSNSEEVIVFFTSSLSFNIAVLTLLIIGIIVIMRATINLVMLAGTFGILAYKKENLEFYLQGIDRIMPANIAHMFHSRAEKGVLLFTADESRAVIDWIEEKFSHQNRYINYFTGTVLMIGLLGTFTGLLVAIDDMGRIILSLTGDIDLGEVIKGFSGPLGGMAIGFGSSLFGVVAAIIMGVMGYILNKNQEILIEGVEDWLKGRIIDTPSGSGNAGATIEPQAQGGDLPEHRTSFMDVFVDTIGSLTKEMANIAQTNDRLHSITIASVQAARDEHEQNYELFERINDNLSTISDTAKEGNAVTQEKLEQQSQATQQLLGLQKELLASLQNDIKTVVEQLQSDNNNSTEKIEGIQTTLTDISSKLTTENTTLEKLEKLSELNISDLQKQEQTLVELDHSLNTNLKEIQTKIAELRNSSDLRSQELLEKLEQQLAQETGLQKESQKRFVEQNGLLQELVSGSQKNQETLEVIANKEFTTSINSSSEKSSGFFSKLFK